MASKSLSLSGSSGFSQGHLIAGRFEVVRLLGRGSTGMVLLIRDRELGDQMFAMKVPHPHLIADERTLERFKNELLLHRQLSHPEIVRVFNIGQLDNGLPFFTAEYVAGTNLRGLLEGYPGRKLPVADALFILMRILDGLAFAHSKGIIHRDLKAENILVSVDGAVKLADFGLAQSLSQTGDITRTGECSGTPVYMAPEQFEGLTTDARTDLYAVGIIAYELVAGKAPFVGETYVNLARQHLRAQLPLQELAQAGIPEPLIRFIQTCCEKPPSLRYGSAEEARRALDSDNSLATESAKTRLSMTVRRSQREKRDSIRLSVLFRIFAFFGWFVAIYLQAANESNRIHIHPTLIAIQRDHNIDTTWYQRLLGFPVATDSSNFALHRAVRENNHELFRPLIEAKVGPSNPDEDGNLPIHLATKIAPGNAGSIIEHAKHSLQLDQGNAQNETALFLAVRHQNIQMIDTLLRSGANPNIPNKDGDTPLLYATRRQNVPVFVALLGGSRGNLNLSARDKNGFTALHLAATLGDLNIVKTLLDAGSDPDSRDRQGNTPLMLLIAKPFPATIPKDLDLALLVQVPDARNNSGQDIAELLKLADSKWRALLTPLFPAHLQARITGAS